MFSLCFRLSPLLFRLIAGLRGVLRGLSPTPGTNSETFPAWTRFRSAMTVVYNPFRAFVFVQLLQRSEQLPVLLAPQTEHATPDPFILRFHLDFYALFTIYGLTPMTPMTMTRALTTTAPLPP